jgi:hypothetical protein
MFLSRALVGKPEEGDHLEDPGVDGMIILKWFFETLDGGKGTYVGSIWLRIETGCRALVNMVMNLRVP